MNERLEKAAWAYHDLHARKDAATKDRDDALAATHAFEASPEYLARKARLDAMWAESNRLRGVDDNAYLALVQAAKNMSSDLVQIADMYRRAMLRTDVAKKEREEAGATLDALYESPEYVHAKTRWNAAVSALSELSPILEKAEQELLAAAMETP